MSSTDRRTRRALALFREACELDGAERARLLDEACAGAPRLRAEVEALLREDARVAPPLDDAALARGRERLDALLDPPAGVAPRTIGGYRVLAPIGEGGMGLVYEAEQASPRRRVALKVVHPAVLTGERLARLRREAEILGRLQHPGIARIYEAGVDDLGRGAQPYFAMELVEGRALGTYAREAGLDREARLRLLLRVCDAVQHAHDHGVVHRDLKHENILVRADGQPVVLDFGVARATGSDLGLSSARTDERKLVGTLATMSPEQASGSREVDARTDVYALGVLLFELLCGAPPRELAGRPLPAALRSVQVDEPRRLAALDPSLRGDLDTITAKALAREPSRRYASARALAQDVERHLASEPIHARPPSALYRFRKLAARHRALVGGASAAALALVAGTVVSLAFAVRAARQEADAQREAYLARLEAASASLAQGDPQQARRSLLATDAAARGWEWRHLWGQVDGATYPLEGEVAPGSPLAASADGERVVGLRGDALVVWDARSGRRVATHALDAAPTSLASTLVDGAALVGTAAGDVRVVDAAAGGVRAALALGEGAPVVAVAWDARGARAAATTERTLFALRLDLPEGARERVRAVAAAAAPRGFAAVALTPDGRAAVCAEVRSPASGTPMGKLALVSLEDGEVLAERSAAGATLFRSPVVSPDGARVAVGGAFGVSELLDARTLAPLERLGHHRLPVAALAWSADGGTLLTYALDGTLAVRDGRTGAPRTTLDLGTHHGAGSCLALPDGRVVATAGGGTAGRAVGWARGEGAARVLEGHTSYVYNARFAPDGRTLVSRSMHGETIVWDVLEGRALGRTRVRRGYGRMDVGGEVLAVGSESGTVLLDLATLRPAPAELAAGRDPAERLPSAERALSPDGRYVLAGNDRRLRRVEDGEAVAALRGAPVPAPGAAFHPTEPVALLATDRIRGFAVPSGRPLFELDGHAGPVYCAAWSPDAARLATGGADGAVLVWDARSLEVLLALRGHASYVRSVAWSPDGTLLASASGDGTVRLWDAVAPADRHAERLAWRALRDEVRPRVVAALAAEPDPTGAARRLRGDPALAGARRTAALRVLLELAPPE